MVNEEWLNTLHLESVECRCLITNLILVYQILHGHYDTQLGATFILLITLKLEVMSINY